MSTYQGGLEEKLGRPVPERDDLRGVFVLHLVQASSQPPVGDFQVAAAKEKDIHRSLTYSSARHKLIVSYFGYGSRLIVMSTLTIGS